MKVGYRHVYISRKFAQSHSFIPRDATPGHYGYGGLVNIGTWPITLVTSNYEGSNQDRVGGGGSLFRTPTKTGRESLDEMPSPNPSYSSNTVVLSSSRSPVVATSTPPRKGSKRHSSVHQQLVAQQKNGRKPTVTNVQVYLCEEPHFDVVLGRSFFDKRQIQTSSIDPTEVVCLDNGEKIECEVVILRDGKGDIVTVT